VKPLGSHWTDFHEVGIWYFFLKSVEKVSSLTLTPDKYNDELLLCCSIVIVFNEPDS
jgi:hypothetical protein